MSRYRPGIKHHQEKQINAQVDPFTLSLTNGLQLHHLNYETTILYKQNKS